MGSSNGSEPTTSLWIATSEGPEHAPLRMHTTCDVCVVGAGITGMTAALSLAELGHDVVVLDAGRVGGGVTGSTTGKATSLHGLIYDELTERHGAEAAHIYAAAQEGALGHIRQRVQRHGIECDLRTRTAYTYVTESADENRIEREVEAACDAGLGAEFVRDTPLPYPVAAAIRLGSQAEFHARNYVLGLARALTDAGGRIHEHTVATGLDDGARPNVLAGDLRIEASKVIIASHMPFLDRAAWWTRLMAKRSYAIAVEPGGEVPDGMFISAGGPTRSIRSAPHPAGEGELLIIGGEGHTAGEGVDASPERYTALEAFAAEHFGASEVLYRWSSQDLQPADGLPFVGQLTPRSSNVFMASGFRKWGLTGGTAAALALVERVEGRRSPAGELMASWRVTPHKQALHILQEGIKDARHMIGDRLKKPDPRELHELQPGEGALLKHEGELVAASRDRDGKLHAVSAACTHLGCRVAWNTAEGSWDCPCHGSRFAADGKVLEGPAVHDLTDMLTGE